MKKKKNFTNNRTDLLSDSDNHHDIKFKNLLNKKSKKHSNSFIEYNDKSIYNIEKNESDSIDYADNLKDSSYNLLDKKNPYFLGLNNNYDNNLGDVFPNNKIVKDFNEYTEPSKIINQDNLNERNNYLKKNNNSELKKKKSTELKKLIRSYSLRNRLSLNNKDDKENIELQQSINDINKKNKNENNLNISNNNIFKDNSFNPINYQRNQSLNNILHQSTNKNDKYNQTYLKKSETKKSKNQLGKMKSFLKEKELRQLKISEVNQFKKKILNLKEKFGMVNQDFIDFKSFLFKNINSGKHTYLATKKITVDDEEYTYRIFFRFNDMCDSLEFFIDDLSLVLKTEDLRSQFKYKKYFLDKFTHEFRNPILNIRQLVKNVKILYQEYKDNIEKSIFLDSSKTIKNKNKIDSINNTYRNNNQKIQSDRRNSVNVVCKVNYLKKDRYKFQKGIEIINSKLNMNCFEEKKSCKSHEFRTNSKNSSFLNSVNISQTRRTKRENSLNNIKTINHKNIEITSLNEKTDTFDYSFINPNSNYHNIKTNESINKIDFKIKHIPTDKENIITQNHSLENSDNSNCNIEFNNNKKSLNNSKSIFPFLNTKSHDGSNLDYRSIGDSIYKSKNEDFKENIMLTNKKNFIFKDKKNQEIELDLRHIKNICEYMSSLISNFDYISNYQNILIERKITNKFKQSQTLLNKNNCNLDDYIIGGVNNFNSLHNNNHVCNIKDLKKSESLNIDDSGNKSQIENYKNSNQCVILEKRDQYNNDNFISDKGNFGSNLNKLSQNENYLEKTTFDISKFLNNLMKIFQTKIDLSDKKIDLEQYIGMNVPEKISHDHSKIKLIIFNLLSNSVKFTSNGVISIEVDTDIYNIIFTILDSGIGIKQENIEKLLIPINQINIYDNSQHGKIGMGFFVARKFLELLGGTISIDSCYGLGTLIELKIPLNINRIPTKYSVLMNDKNLLTQQIMTQKNNSYNNDIKNSNTIIQDEDKKSFKFLSFKPVPNRKIKEKYGLTTINYKKTFTGLFDKSKINSINLKYPTDSLNLKGRLRTNNLITNQN